MIKKVRNFFEETLLLKISPLRLIGDYGYFANGIMFHSSRTDNQDGHNQYATNSYHYHHGYPAHNHDNNKCPYLPITLWRNENYYTFHSKLTNNVSVDLYDKDDNFIKSYTGNKIYTGSGLNNRGDLIAVTIDTIKDIYNKLSISKYNLQSLDNYCSLESFVDGDCNFVYNFTENKVILKQYYITLSQFKKIGWSNTNTNNKMVEDFNNMLIKYNINEKRTINHLLAQCTHESRYGRDLKEGDQLIKDHGHSVQKVKDYYNKLIPLGGNIHTLNYTYIDRGVGYIQTTFYYQHMYFAIDRFKYEYPNYTVGKVTSNHPDSIEPIYEEIISLAKENNLNISQITDIVDVGTDYTALNYA